MRHSFSYMYYFPDGRFCGMVIYVYNMSKSLLRCARVISFRITKSFLALSSRESAATAAAATADVIFFVILKTDHFPADLQPFPNDSTSSD